MRRQTEAYLYGLAAVLLWSTVASVFKLTLRRVGPLTLLFYSSLTSMLLLQMLRRLPGLGRLGGVPRARGSRWQAAWARSLLGGALNPFLYYLVLFAAYRMLPAQVALPLNYTWPLVLGVMAALFTAERIPPRGFLALAVSLLGVTVIATSTQGAGSEGVSPEGVVLALGSALLWASFWLLNKSDPRPAVEKLSRNFLAGFPLVAALCWIMAGRASAWGLPAWLDPGGFPPPADGPALAGCIYVGCFEMGLTFVLWLQSLTLAASTARVSNLVYLSPFLSMLLIALVVGEEIMAPSLVGLALVVGGIALQSWRR